MWGNIAPLVLYTDLQRCFLKLALPHLKTVLCILPLPGESKFEITLKNFLVNQAVCVRVHLLSRRMHSHSQTAS